MLSSLSLAECSFSCRPGHQGQKPGRVAPAEKKRKFCSAFFFFKKKHSNHNLIDSFTLLCSHHPLFTMLFYLHLLFSPIIFTICMSLSVSPDQICYHSYFLPFMLLTANSVLWYFLIWDGRLKGLFKCVFQKESSRSI